MNLMQLFTTEAAIKMFKPNDIAILNKYLYLSDFNIDDLLTNESTESLVEKLSFKIKNTREQEVTGVILVKNQSKKIVSTVNNVVKILDYVSVIDTGSTDSTLQIVKGLSKTYENLSTYQLDWVEDFALMRNKSFEFSKTKWVLNIDSDEIIMNIDYLSLHFILKFLAAFFDLNSRDICVQIHLFKDHNNSSYGLGDRLFVKSPHLEMNGKVHEEFSSTRAFQLIESKIALINSGKDSNDIVKFNKLERYQNLLEKMINKDPNNSRWASVVEIDAISGGLCNEWYYNLLLEANFNNKNYFKPASLKINKYSHYNLERLILVLIARNQLEDASKVSTIAQRAFPDSSAFLFYEFLIKKIKLDSFEDQYINKFIMRFSLLNLDNSRRTSQRKEDIIYALLGQYFIKIGEYDKSLSILKKIKDSEAKNLARAELSLFGLD